MPMVEAKMKPRMGKGTPHPKARRFLVHTSHEGHNLFNEIQHNIPDQPEPASTKRPLENLFFVHGKVTQTLRQIDELVLNIHKLASSNHLVSDEVQNFADALASIDASLQDWSTFLKAAADRSSLVHIDLQQEPCNSGSFEPTPVRGGKFPDLSSPNGDLEYGVISYSPLVATGLLDCESPCDSEPLVCTPLSISGCTRTTTSSSPLPQTPHMLSPPRSVQILSTISESPLSTPSRFLDFNTRSDHQEPKPQDLSTPEGSTYQTRLVFQTPLSQVTRHEQLNDDPIFLRTPRFGVSPPRTCRPLQHGETISIESDPTPIMPSPLRTPGLSLECKNVASDCSSADSPEIVDDLTASTVKRLGPRGLEERLWQELTLRKADILQPAKQR